MIPPSIVLIFYGLVTETSIKALFTASFLPGFMLASFFIIYIIVRTRLNPDQAPLPEPDPGDPEGGEKGMMFLGFLACASPSGSVRCSAAACAVLHRHRAERGARGRRSDPAWHGHRPALDDRHHCAVAVR